MDGELTRLDLNESPLPPPREVLEAGYRALAQPHKYSAMGMLEELEDLISAYSGVEREMVAVGCGGDSILAALLLVSRVNSDVIAIPKYSFSMYRVLARESGSRTAIVDMFEEGDRWIVRFEDLLEAAKRASLVIVDNPNNPTGSLLLTQGMIRELAETAKGLVVVDEAYYEFSGSTAAPLVMEYGNLAVVRTFSKAFAMAGMRVGYLIASPRIAGSVKRLFPFPTSTPSLAMAIAALANRSYVASLVEYVRSKREEVREALRDLGMKAYRSEANFLLVNTGVENAAEKLRSRGVHVRRTEIGDSYIRVTVGSSRDMERFLGAVREISQISQP